MTELVLYVCLLTAPESCKTVHKTFTDDLNLTLPAVCAKVGQVEGAQWIEANPSWFIKRWTCGIPGNKADI